MLPLKPRTICVCMWVHMCVCVCACVHACVCVCACVCVRAAGHLADHRYQRRSEVAHGSGTGAGVVQLPWEQRPAGHQEHPDRLDHLLRVSPRSAARHTRTSRNPQPALSTHPNLTNLHNTLLWYYTGSGSVRLDSFTSLTHFVESAGRDMI